MSKQTLYPGDPGYVPDHELGMFSPKNLAKSTDPDTSKQAANGARELIKKHESLILDCLQKHKSGTAEQIAAYINLDGHRIDGVKVSRRMRGLVLAGKVIDSGLKGTTQSGRQAIVWRIKESI